MIHPSVLWITSSVSHNPNANMYCNASIVIERQQPISNVWMKDRFEEKEIKNPKGINKNKFMNTCNKTST